MSVAAVQSYSVARPSLTLRVTIGRQAPHSNVRREQTVMPEELFDVVDDHDVVQRQAPRSQVHANHWLHRAVHVFVFNSHGQLLLQMRSPWKDEHPSTYTSSASGHLGAGETYAEAAPRELFEELGLTGELEQLRKFPACPATSYEHTVLYRLITDEPPRIDPQEIAEVSFHSLEEIFDMLSREPEKFSPCLVTLFRWYVSAIRRSPS